MTTTPDDDLARLAGSVERLVDRIDTQAPVLELAVTELSSAVEALDRHRRRAWLAIGALAAVVVLSLIVAWLWVTGTSRREQIECRRDNDTRVAVVEAARVGVEASMAEVTGDEPEARRVADLTAERVSRDPALRLREC